MKVFISWSGERSHAVAKALHEELACLMNEIEPFISSEDIEKGTAWFPHISNELASSDFGIICLTPENIESRWVHFEAGALACKFSNKKVAPLLIELEESQLRPPLSQLNFTRFKRDDFLKLMSAINGNLKKPLGDDNLRKSFERWWLPFETEVTESLKQFRLHAAMKPERRDDREILEEILALVRSVATPSPWTNLAGLSALTMPRDLIARDPATISTLDYLAELGRNVDPVPKGLELAKK
jgi:TIR domain